MRTAVEYGVPTDKCALQLRLGIEKRFFADEGIDLAIRVVFGGPEIAAAFDAGTLRIGEMGTPPGLVALANGARFRIIGSGVRRGAVQFFVAHPRFSDWPDLQAARLGALSRGSCSYWFMRQVLGHNGIDPDHDVTIVSLGTRYPQVLDLLESGELDGAIIAEPNVTMGERRNLFRVWLGLNGVDYVPRMQWTVAVANTDALAAEPTMVQAVLRACRRSYHYAARNREEWADFGARHFGIAPEIMTACIAREIDDLHFDCEIDLPGLEAAIALQHGLGALPRPLEIGEIVDLRFLQPRASARVA
jgi:NitT/TauT family transport system substrate-binding protein